MLTLQGTFSQPFLCYPSCLHMLLPMPTLVLMLMLILRAVLQSGSSDQRHVKIPEKPRSRAPKQVERKKQEPRKIKSKYEDS